MVDLREEAGRDYSRQMESLYENDSFSQRRKGQDDEFISFTLADLGDFARDIFMLRCVREEMIVGINHEDGKGGLGRPELT